METPKTLAECSVTWLAKKKDFVKPTTYHSYSMIVRKKIIPEFADRTGLTEDEVQEFAIRLTDGGSSKKYTKDIIAVLKQVLKFMCKLQGIPCPDMNIRFRSDASEKKLQVLSIKDQRKLMRHLTGSPDASNIGTLMSLCTGMRIGEVLGLKWSDVDMRNRTITVARTVGRVYDCESKETRIYEQSPKTRSSNREIPMAAELWRAMAAVRKSCPDAVYVVGGGEKHKDPRCYRETFARLLARLGIPRIVFHGLRHTFATRCVEGKCDYKTLSNILGHSKIATTLDLYVHSDLDQKKKCINMFSKMLSVGESEEDVAK